MSTRRKTRKSTPRQRNAGKANLLRFRAHNGRPALQHGIESLLQNGRVPPVPDAERIAADADAIVGEMVSDLGGPSELTAQKRAIVESQRMCLLVLGLANSFIRREGLLSKKGKPHALLSTVVSFANTLRLNGVTLGLERKPRRVGPSNLTEYLERPEPEASS